MKRDHELANALTTELETGCPQPVLRVGDSGVRARRLQKIDLGDAQRLNRRGFLRTATAAAAAVLVGEWGASLLNPGPRQPAEPACLTDAGTLAPGEARALTPDGAPQPMLLVRLDAESLVAFDRRCPHLGCPVLWSAARARFECPCHAAAFDARTGAVLQGPPRRGLEPIDFELRGTEVWLRRRNEEKGVG